MGAAGMFLFHTRLALRLSAGFRQDARSVVSARTGFDRARHVPWGMALLYAPYVLFDAIERANLAEAWALAFAPLATLVETRTRTRRSQLDFGRSSLPGGGNDLAQCYGLFVYPVIRRVCSRRMVHPTNTEQGKRTNCRPRAGASPGAISLLLAACAARTRLRSNRACDRDPRL